MPNQEKKLGLKISLEWSTFSEAADEAGLSRLFSGIHFEDGDINGRILGREVASAVYEETLFYINGGEETESLDFEESDLAAETVISDQFTGVTISSDGLSPMIFDTANPTGGDSDLASDTLGNVLILSEDGDSSNPDDNATGGTFYFDWHDPINLESVSLIDVEDIGGSISAYSEDNQVLGSFDTSNLTDDGGTGSVDIGLDDVSRMELTLVGSGAIAEISYS
ncbi:MAG: hypothetical protein AAGE84_05295 [Cyanobacteria bacterium P01_G01_bin.39]